MSRQIFLSAWSGRVPASLLCLLFAMPVLAQQRFDVAVIDDGPTVRLSEARDVYVNELLTLTQNEFDIRIRDFTGNWTRESLDAALDAAYADPEIDLVLVTGFVASQIGTQRGSYPKPTFLPVVLDPGLLSTPPVDRRSGIRNLSYLLTYANFGEDLDAIGELKTVDKVGLFIDAELSRSIPRLRIVANEICEARGIELVEVTYDGVDHALMDRLPDDTDAVFVAGLARMPADKFAELVAAINARGVASYSFVGTRDVELGLLMTSSETRDVERQARLNALNMQAVMLGERAQDQLVSYPGRKQYTINMATARQLGISPSFDVLAIANLLNEREAVDGRGLGLIDIAETAIRQNQDLLSQVYATEAGAEAIANARAILLPQLDATVGQTIRKQSPTVEAGLFAERSSDASLGVSQLIYSDAAAANLNIQKQLQVSREASLEELELDIVQAAATAYYNVLNARAQLEVQETNLSVTRRNLQLARDRVEVGTSSSADIYRWQAEEARSQITVLDARAAVYQAWVRLNRLLNRPQQERFALLEADFNDPFVITRIEFESLVASPADYRRFSDFVVERGLNRTPELVQVNAQILAKERELTNRRRERWLPEFSIGGQLTSNLGQSGAGAGVTAGQEQDDWNFGVQATLPLFNGGGLRAEVSRAGFELRQLQALRVSTSQRVEERIREQLLAAQADFGRIGLTQVAAEAARKNFELVADAYGRGAVTIIQLLDAQDASLSADAASIDSLYRFLSTIMALQRAAGGYDFLLPADERAALADTIRERLR